MQGFSFFSGGLKVGCGLYARGGLHAQKYGTFFRDFLLIAQLHCCSFSKHSWRQEQFSLINVAKEMLKEMQCKKLKHILGVYSLVELQPVHWTPTHHLTT